LQTEKACQSPKLWVDGELRTGFYLDRHCWLSKSLWVFLTQESLWSLILTSKYIALLSIVDWIHKRNKNTPNTSTQWRALIQAFPMIGKHLAWKVDNGTHVRIGSDTIVKCGDNVFLAEDLKLDLCLKGYCTLNQVANMETSSIWAQNWYSTMELELEHNWSQIWSDFTSELQRAHIHLKIQLMN
jgi:hypothetical protein